ncbi:MAG: MMPL family transporter [Sedimentisphaerales bacterium]|nr:MMPL family transporter [Sedimentisphaerales bacterium]
MSRFEAIFGRWVVQHRWWMIGATVLVVLATSGGMRFLTVNNNTRVFFSEGNPQLKALEALENMFSKDNDIFFAIAPKDGSVFTRESLEAVEELTELSWQMPHSSRVNSITNFQHTRSEQDDLIVENLVEDAAGLSDGDLERIKAIALSEPLLVNSLISPSGHVTGVNVTILLPRESQKEVPEIAAYARGLADTMCATYPGIDIYLTGGIMIDYTFGQTSERDVKILIPLMFLTLVVLVGLSLRSFWGTLSVLVIILISMVTGLGLAGWLGISLNAASIGAPVLILTLAVADSIHILATMFHLMRLGKPRREAIAEALRMNLHAVFLTSITTVIGFLSMNFSEAPPFRDLGNIVAMGVTAAFAYSVLFLPALLAVLPVRIASRPDEAERHCDRLARFVLQRHKTVFWGMLVVTGVLAVGIFHIELNDNFLMYFDDSFEFRRATDFVIDNLAGWDVLEYSLKSAEPGGINDPEYLATVEAFANWYREQPKVVHVLSITDTLKRLNKNMHGDDPAYFRVPEQRELAAQYMLLYEMMLPFGLDLNNQITVDRSATRLTVHFKSLSANEIRAVDNAAQQWLKANAPAHMFTHGTGLSMVWAHITSRNIRSMLWASFLALVLISAILMLAFRSFRLGLISLIPNLSPALIAFGVWGITVRQVGLGLSVIVSMTIGIVVDDTVHFMSKYIRARREQHMDAVEGVRYAFNTVGTAMWVTTVALVAGFLVLTFSHYRMSSDMGYMSALTIALALAMDFLLLPTLLIKVRKWTDKTVKTDIVKET